MPGRKRKNRRAGEQARSSTAAAASEELSLSGDGGAVTSVAAHAQTVASSAVDMDCIKSSSSDDVTVSASSCTLMSESSSTGDVTMSAPSDFITAMNIADTVGDVDNNRVETLSATSSTASIASGKSSCYSYCQSTMHWVFLQCCDAVGGGGVTRRASGL